GEVEAGGHPAVALDAPAEGHCDQPTLEVVDPLVVRADPLRRPAGIPHAELHAPVRAAVHVAAQLALGVAGHDHGAVADEGPLVVARFGELARQPDVVPRRPTEDALLLPGVD